MSLGFCYFEAYCHLLFLSLIPTKREEKLQTPNRKDGFVIYLQFIYLFISGRFSRSGLSSPICEKDVLTLWEFMSKNENKRKNENEWVNKSKDMCDYEWE